MKQKKQFLLSRISPSLKNAHSKKDMAKETAPKNTTRLKRAHKSKPQIKGRHLEIVIGIILIVGGVIFSFSFRQSSTLPEKTILILAKDIQKDSVLSAAHLSTVKVSGDVGTLLSTEANSVIGKRATIDLSARSPVLSTHFSSIPKVADGYVLAGLHLQVGEYPLSKLRAGDFVDIFSTEEADILPLKQIQIHSVIQLREGTAPDLLVSFPIPESSQMQFVEISSAGGVRLFINPLRENAKNQEDTAKESEVVQ